MPDGLLCFINGKKISTHLSHVAAHKIKLQEEENLTVQSTGLEGITISQVGAPDHSGKFSPEDLENPLNEREPLWDIDWETELKYVLREFDQMLGR